MKTFYDIQRQNSIILLHLKSEDVPTKLAASILTKRSPQKKKSLFLNNFFFLSNHNSHAFQSLFRKKNRHIAQFNLANHSYFFMFYDISRTWMIPKPSQFLSSFSSSSHFIKKHYKVGKHCSTLREGFFSHKWKLKRIHPSPLRTCHPCNTIKKFAHLLILKNPKKTHNKETQLLA